MHSRPSSLANLRGDARRYIQTPARISAGICATLPAAPSAVEAMSAHRPVMLAQALAGLALRAGGRYVDATFGRGGHSAEILAAIGESGQLHAFDQDPQAAQYAQMRFGTRANFRIHACSFERIAEIAQVEGFAGQIDGVLFDLGVSSPQLDDAGRGFSFLRDGPLDMRMDPRAGESAAEWLDKARERDIADVLWRLGEERHSRRIARAVVRERMSAGRIETTGRLAEIIASAVPGPRGRIHPATRSFQAIRIHINRELEMLPAALAAAASVLAPGGRLCVISFHSLEDRIVKRYIRDAGLSERDPVTGAAVPGSGPAVALKSIGRVFPDDEETASNPRSRSAVLRIAERLP